MREDATKLEINSELYESGVKFAKVCRKLRHESCLKAIEQVAGGAWLHHPGRFADGALENIAFGIGRTIEKKRTGTPSIPDLKKHLNRTLHVATTLYEVGGHSRVLAKWAERDVSSEHLIVLTDQKQRVPEFLERVFKRNGNHIICLPINKSIQDRALMLREIWKLCDRVILHTHPNDSIPVVAFSNKNGCPVAMFNHAHFSFNLGSSVSDIIVNTLEYYRNISVLHRFAKATYCLSGFGGIVPFDNKIVDKEAAKRQLSLPENATVLMSIGKNTYFTPMEGYNFFHTARRILERLPDAYFMIVGIERDSHLVPEDLRNHRRFLLMGVIPNPMVYYRASDICLESFPMPSLGALNEAVAYGEAFPVPVYGKGENILRVGRSSYRFPYRPPDENAYVEYVVDLMNRKKEIRAEARRIRTEIQEDQKFLEERILSLNNLIDGLDHCPGEIPVVKNTASEDSRLLANMDQSEIGKKIDDFLPFIPFALHHIGSAFRHRETYHSAFQHSLNRLKLALERRILKW